jgi:hypothetical protein
MNDQIQAITARVEKHLARNNHSHGFAPINCASCEDQRIHNNCDNLLSELLLALLAAETAREEAIKALDARDEDNPAAQAIDDLWRDIILARDPNYGTWEYPGQAYRHLLAEFKELIAKLEAAEGRAQEAETRVGRYREALNIIASWSEGESVDASFDEPRAAQVAQETLKAEKSGRNDQ